MHQSDLRKDLKQWSEQVSPRRALVGIWRYRWVIALCSLAGFVLAIAWVMVTPRLYEAQVTLEYDPNPQSPLGHDFAEDAGVGRFLMSKEFFETQNRIIASRSVAERVVGRLNLTSDSSFFGAESRNWRPPAPEVAAQRLQGKLVVEPVKDTRLVVLKVRDTDPNRATIIVNALADTYIQKTIEDRLGSSVASAQWLQKRLSSSQEQLKEAELALHDFKKKHNVLSVPLEERQNLIGEELQTFSERLNLARTQRIELQAQLDQLKRIDLTSLGTSVPEVTASSTRLDSIRASLSDKMAERAALAVKYGTAHPELQKIDSELAALRTTLLEEVKSQIAVTTSKLEEAKAVEHGMRDALNDAQNRGLDLNLKEIEYTNLYRQRENDAKLYDLLLSRNTETDLSRLLTTTHVRWVDRALVPTAPVYPVIPLTLAAGLLAGFVLGALMAFVLYRLDRKVRFIEEVESLGLPVIGVLPSIDLDPSILSAQERKLARATRGASMPTQTERLLEFYPMSSTAEACRTIRANLLFAGAETALDILLVTSPNPKEGKTTIASNLAIAFAQNGQRVLLIDTDLRRPRMEAIYKLNDSKGMSDYLTRNLPIDQVLYKTSIDNLHITPAGTPSPNPAELLHSEGFARFLGEARQRYDRVVLDSPPIFAVSDAAVIAPQCSGALIVVRADQTSRDSISYLMRTLQATNVHIVGAVINDLGPDRSLYGKSGYYSYGYGYDNLPVVAAPGTPNRSAA